MCFLCCHQAPFHHLFFIFYCAIRKDEVVTKETLGELGQTPVSSTGKLRCPHFICF